MQRSASASPGMAGLAASEDEEVKDTTRIKLAYDAKGRRMVNQYIRLREIGRGTHGRVWLCEEIDPDTGANLGLCAMKEVYREEPQRNLKKAQTARHGTPKPLFVSPFQAAADADSNPVTPTALASPLPWHVQEEYLSPTSQQEINPLEDVAAYNRKRASSSLTPSIRQYDGSDLSSLAGSAAALDETPSTQQEKLGPVAGLYMSKQRARRSPLQMDEKVRQEIAIMKRCHHKHVVKLKEVINDPQSKKIFLVLEYMAGGQIVWQQTEGLPEPAMTIDQARQTFRDVLLGLEYLHYQGIIHRDIKPANLLWLDDTRKCVKISDFGVSHLSETLARSVEGNSATSLTDRALRKTAGSPAFFAPELCYSSEYSPLATPLSVAFAGAALIERDTFAQSFQSSSSRPSTRDRPLSARTITTISRPLLSPPVTAYEKRRESLPPIGKAIDVWALGVTLYCLLFGTTPFRAETEYMLYNIIPREEAPIPEWAGADHLSTESDHGKEIVDLLGRLLEKDPLQRITLAEVKAHPWVMRNLNSPDTWLDRTNPANAAKLTITTEDLQQATADRFVSATRSGLRNSLKKAVARFGNAIASRSNRRQSVSSTSAISSLADTWSEGSGSQPPTRKTSSIMARKASPPLVTNPEIGRKWSIRSRFGGNTPSASSKVSTPLTNEHDTPFLSRSMSGSSIATSASAADPQRGRLLKLPSEPTATSMRRPISAAEFSTDPSFADDFGGFGRKSFSSAGAERERHSLHSSDAEHKLSIRYVWDKLRAGSQSGSRTPNSSPRPRRQQRADVSCTEEDTDADSVAPQSPGMVSIPDLSMAVESERTDFDQFGRKKMRPAEEDDFEEDDGFGDDSRQLDEDDFDDEESLSELDEGGDFRGSQSLAWNEGKGWRYHDEDRTGSGVHTPDTEQAPLSAEQLITPKPKLQRIDISPEPPNSPVSSHRHEESAIYSGDDADAEHDDDEEEEDAIHLDFRSKRRRGTHELLTSPVDLHSPTASHPSPTSS